MRTLPKRALRHLIEQLHCPKPRDLVTMFMLKKKKPQVDTSKQMKAVAWDLTKIAAVFITIRAASVLLNQETY
ncbi:hypothetical protein Poli38472_001648 [Pythium oligandrum]|uniref:Uncharacterized protein n=1 Tax=Pythium oligandrum TaxID=41045 RepID=A0A8K1CV70_PYTOL|nr:hypothetical protein Poli38472_001648 [Pythium oligandrum]|eukprot:TMW69492.1 hypothetical protein Poli38472_001648 [Pythium oligandrum]